MNFAAMEDSIYGNVEDDAELLAELAQLQEEENRKAGRSTGQAPVQKRAQKANPAGAFGIDQKELALALKDAPDDVDDETLENDEELLNELSGLVGHSSNPPPVTSVAAPAVSTGESEQVSHLKKLHTAYSALMATASKNGEGSKERRYRRATEKLTELIGKASRGQKIDPNDIPAEPPNFSRVANAPSEVSQPVAPEPPAPPARRPEPKEEPPRMPVRHPEPETKPPPLPPRMTSQTEALSTDTDDKKKKIIALLKHRKELFVENGKKAIAAHDKESAKHYIDSAKAFDQAIAGVQEMENAEEVDLSEIPSSPKPYRPKPQQQSQQPQGFVECLEARRNRYQGMAEKAKQDGNDRKSRMNLRIVGQYDEAIKEAKKGRPVNVDELPALPDMTPLPPQTKRPAAAPAAQRPPVSAQSGSSSQSSAPAPAQSRPLSLQERQQRLKLGAMEAKKKGDLDLARKFLAEIKKLDLEIENEQSNLKSRAAAQTLEGRQEQLQLMERTLIDQIKLAEEGQMKFTRIGDDGKAKLFESWARLSKQDLLIVRTVARENLNLPRFAYEMKELPATDNFLHLAEDVLELTLTKCRDVPLPSGYEPHHAAIYIKYAFAYPSDAPQIGKSKTVSGTTSPEFNEPVILKIGSGKARNQKLLRAIKRSGMKFEVYQKGGFLRSDKLLGSCEWKIDSLEATSELIESLPLREGRKAVGGLLSARIRIREPLGPTKPEIKKWLLIKT